MKATTIRMDDDVLSRIDGIARSLSRSRTWVINHALEKFIEYEEWFIQEVQAGLDEVNRGEVATDKEAAEKFKKWGVNVS